MDKNRFSQFEERIQALVEGGFARLFAGRLKPREVAIRLAWAMEDAARVDASGVPAAPNCYVVRLHPDDLASLLESQPDLAAELAGHIVDLARESGFCLEAIPEVALIPDETVASHDVVVEAEHDIAVPEKTQVMRAADPDAPDDVPDVPELPRAFLVVEGDRYIPLERTVINIGRRRDNTIVLDDRRVSRRHCQLRFRYGEFVLYDLASRGGTFVNDGRISECVLRSGDVISLAGVKLVYMVEEGTTGHFPPPGGDTQVNLHLADHLDDRGDEDALEGDLR